MLNYARESYVGFANCRDCSPTLKVPLYNVKMLSNKKGSLIWNVAWNLDELSQRQRGIYSTVLGMVIIANYCVSTSVPFLAITFLFNVFVSHLVLFAMKDVVHFGMLKGNIVRTWDASTIIFSVHWCNLLHQCRESQGHSNNTFCWLFK